MQNQALPESPVIAPWLAGILNVTYWSDKEGGELVDPVWLDARDEHTINLMVRRTKNPGTLSLYINTGEEDDDGFPISHLYDRVIAIEFMEVANGH